MIRQCTTYFMEIKQEVQVRNYHFEIPLVGRTYRGTNAITRIGLLVPSEESLHYWKERFEKFDVKHSEMTTYANRPALQFEDAEGLRLVLLVSNGEK